MFSLPGCTECGALGLASAGPASQLRLHAPVCGSDFDLDGCTRYPTVAGTRFQAESSCRHVVSLKKTHPLELVRVHAHTPCCMCVWITE